MLAHRFTDEQKMILSQQGGFEVVVTETLSNTASTAPRERRPLGPGGCRVFRRS